MQDWNKIFIYQDGVLIDRSTGKLLSKVIHGHNQVSSTISTHFETSSAKVGISYRCDKIIFEMHTGLEVYAPNLKHLDGNLLNDKIENLSLPELETHPMDVPEFKKFLNHYNGVYSERYNSSVTPITLAEDVVRYMPLYTKYALNRKCVIRSHPKVELKNLNWVLSGREIPKGMQLNQIDGDYRRCDIDNLELVPTGTPLKQLEGLHTNWFVKNGKLFNRNAFRVSLMPAGSLWMHYDSDTTLSTYSCIIETPDQPFDHSMRAIYPYADNTVVINDLLVSNECVVSHLVNGTVLEGKLMTKKLRLEIKEYFDKLYNSLLVQGISKDDNVVLPADVPIQQDLTVGLFNDFFSTGKDE